MIMARTLRLLALAALAMLLLLPRPAAARTLRVLTYNIHHGEGRDGVLDLERIASVINAAQPDLVALQELDQGTTRTHQHLELDELGEMTGLNGFFGKTINYQGGAYGNGVLVNPAFEVLTLENHTMPNPANGEQRKVMELHMRIDDDGTSRRFDFFATHLDNSSGTNRQAQVDFINGLVADSTTPAILGGDFNLHEQETPYSTLVTQWNDPTSANPGRSSQIDYVVDRALDQWYVVEQGRFIVNATTAVASDHYPLLAVLELSPYSADFNNDGRVDGWDLLGWQRNVGRVGASVVGDANHDHTVNGADLAIWKQQVGQAGLAEAVSTVPEPATAVVIAPLLMVCGLLRRPTNSAATSNLRRRVGRARSCRR
jgi:endonuclease/exonuclease/phosphatase family metal-dependent hydrolase